MLVPTLEVAVVQVTPLSSETSTVSPFTRFASSTPLMVCAAVLVMKSELLVPVSAEKARLVTSVDGGPTSNAWLRRKSHR